MLCTRPSFDLHQFPRHTLVIYSIAPQSFASAACHLALTESSQRRGSERQVLSDSPKAQWIMSAYSSRFMCNRARNSRTSVQKGLIDVGEQVVGLTGLRNIEHLLSRGLCMGEVKVLANPRPTIQTDVTWRYMDAHRVSLRERTSEIHSSSDSPLFITKFTG